MKPAFQFTPTAGSVFPLARRSLHHPAAQLAALLALLCLPWAAGADTDTAACAFPGPWTAPTEATQLRNLDGNPLIGGDPWVMYDEGKFKMWHTAFIAHTLGTTYAESVDGLRWREPRNDHGDRQLVLKPTPGAWDWRGIETVSVVKKDHRYYLWYLGYPGSIPEGQGRNDFIGLATSDDGVHWDKYPEPVLQAEFDWEQPYQRTVFEDGHDVTAWAGGLQEPSVIWEADEGVFKMWFAAQVFEDILDDGRDRPFKVWRIGYATSEDGIHWKQYPQPVFEPTGKPGTFDAAATSHTNVIADPGHGYHLFYAGGGSIDSIGHAYSPDGIHWQRDPANPLVPGQTTATETDDDPVILPHGDFDQAAGQPSALFRNGRIYLYFARSQPDDHSFAGVVTQYVISAPCTGGAGNQEPHPAMQLGIANPPTRDPQTFRFSAEHLKRLQVQEVRLGANWPQIEPQAGRFEWSSLDRFLDWTAHNDLQLMLLVTSQGPQWACDPTRIGIRNGCVPKDMNDFRDYVQQLLAHLATARSERGRAVISSIQFSNEWDDPAVGYYPGTAAEFVTQLNIVYDEVKAVFPDMPVLPGGLLSNAMAGVAVCTLGDRSPLHPDDIGPDYCTSDTYLNHLQRMRDVFSQGRYDMVDQHLYFDVQYWPVYVEMLRQVVLPENRRGVPLMVSEFGGPNALKTDRDDAGQANLLREYLRTLSKLDLAEAYFFTLVEPDETDRLGNPSPFAHSGLIAKGSRNPKPAYDVFMRFARELNGANRR